jgi:hypothetical protein
MAIFNLPVLRTYQEKIMNWSTTATLLAMTLAIYLALTDWVNLAPWNNVEDLPVRQKILISLANYTPLLFIAFACTQQNRIVIVLAVIIGIIDLIMHISYWWIPYLRGASEQQKQEHVKLFGSTTTFLPGINDNPIPNAQHVVVGILMLSMVIGTLMTASTIFA